MGFRRIGYSVADILKDGIDKKAYGFIYITTNLITDDKYIGQKRFDDRWKYYLGSGRILLKAIKKYGYKSFSRKIIEVCNSKEELDELERFYIKLHDATKNDAFYNIADGGHNGNPYAGKTKEEMEEILKKTTHKGEDHPMCGRHHTEEAKRKISESKNGKFCCKDNANYGKKLSDEARRKMSENHADFSGSNSPKARKVVCITTSKVFGAITEAGLFYKVQPSDITTCCKGRLKHAGRHPETGEQLVWMYYEEWLDKRKDEV